ncbi:GNAT family N-acetyltransferase [Streptomyces sp. NPDC059118]|uniref:GNAT family N-acetyltransferase n=1 Tax=unclassified Streptomyces TaxID=2593676 RepID=UPI00369E59CF
MRCDPAMMAEPGGPLPHEGMETKVQCDVRRAEAGTDWTKMIVPDEAEPEVVAGTVTLWPHGAEAEHISEIGWMALPELQGRGLDKQGVRMLLELARDDGRWGLIRVIPATANGPSNGIPIVRAWAAAYDVELVFLPTYGSWLNWIESEFAALRHFALKGTDHRSHGEQNAAIGTHVRRGNSRAEPKNNFAPGSPIRTWTDYPTKAA